MKQMALAMLDNGQDHDNRECYDTTNEIASNNLWSFQGR